jgi:hypothetical protein
MLLSGGGGGGGGGDDSTAHSVNRNVPYPYPRPQTETIVRRGKNANNVTGVLDRWNSSFLEARPCKPGPHCRASVLQFEKWASSTLSQDFEFRFGSVLDEFRDYVHAHVIEKPRVFGVLPKTHSFHILEPSTNDPAVEALGYVLQVRFRTPNLARFVY